MNACCKIKALVGKELRMPALSFKIIRWLKILIWCLMRMNFNKISKTRHWNLQVYTFNRDKSVSRTGKTNQAWAGLPKGSLWSQDQGSALKTCLWDPQRTRGTSAVSSLQLIQNIIPAEHLQNLAKIRYLNWPNKTQIRRLLTRMSPLERLFRSWTSIYCR